MFAVHTPAGVEPYRWHRAVALAWAQFPTGLWACLLAWQDLRTQESGPARLEGRWSWCRYDPARFTPAAGVHVPNPWGLGWHGMPEAAPIQDAIAEAAASLPAGIRGLAAAPAVVIEPPQ